MKTHSLYNSTILIRRTFKNKQKIFIDTIEVKTRGIDLFALLSLSWEMGWTGILN